MHSILRSLLNESYLIPDGVVESVFMHTSCVLDSTLSQIADSKYLNSKYSFYITNDCYNELILLKNRSKVKAFADNAGILLRLCKRVAKLNLRDLYGFLKSDHSSVLIRILKPSEKRPYIFAFYNGAAAEEFVNYTLPDDEIRRYNNYNQISMKALDCVKILLLNKNEDCSADVDYMYISPVRLSAFNGAAKRNKRFRKPPYIINISEEIYLSENGEMPSDETSICLRYIDSRKVQHVDIKNLKNFTKGGMAFLYRIDTPEIKNKVAKIFIKKRKDHSVVDFLTYLAQFNSVFGDRMTLPEALIYNSKNEFIGYTMNELKGTTCIKSIDSTDFMQSKEHAAQLSLMLLEMRLLQLEMNDISNANISVTKTGQVVLFDSDSIENRKYVYNKILRTEAFAHPDLLGDKSLFRAIRFNDFAYSIVLFQLFMLFHPLDNNCIGGESDDYKDWLQAAKYGIKCITENSTEFFAYSDNVWLNLFTPDQRRAFLSNFDFTKKTLTEKTPKINFVKTPTIGQWLGILNIS